MRDLPMIERVAIRDVFGRKLGYYSVVRTLRLRPRAPGPTTTETEDTPND